MLKNIRFLRPLSVFSRQFKKPCSIWQGNVKHLKIPCSSNFLWSWDHLRCMDHVWKWMLQWKLGITLLNLVPNETTKITLGIATIHEKMREAHLRWNGHVSRSHTDFVIKWITSRSPIEKQPRGPKIGGQSTRRYAKYRNQSR